jgi:hypothetical protein
VAALLENPEAVAALLCCIQPVSLPNTAADTATATESAPSWEAEPEAQMHKMHEMGATGMAQPPAAPPAAARGSKGAPDGLRQQVLSDAALSSSWWLLPPTMQQQLEEDVPRGGAAEALLKRAVARMHFSRESHQLGDLGNSLALVDP